MCGGKGVIINNSLFFEKKTDLKGFSKIKPKNQEKPRSGILNRALHAESQ